MMPFTKGRNSHTKFPVEYKDKVIFWEKLMWVASLKAPKLRQDTTVIFRD